MAQSTQWGRTKIVYQRDRSLRRPSNACAFHCSSCPCATAATLTPLATPPTSPSAPPSICRLSYTLKPIRLHTPPPLHTAAAPHRRRHSAPRPLHTSATPHRRPLHTAAASHRHHRSTPRPLHTAASNRRRFTLPPPSDFNTCCIVPGTRDYTQHSAAPHAHHMPTTSGTLIPTIMTRVKQADYWPRGYRSMHGMEDG